MIMVYIDAMRKVWKGSSKVNHIACQSIPEEMALADYITTPSPLPSSYLSI